MAKIVMNKKIVDVAVNRGLIKEQKETKKGCEVMISKLFHSRTQSHVFHLQTNSHSEHKALEGYYDEIVDLIDGISLEFEQWRFNLRSSNTEPVVRLNLESRGNVDLMKEKTAEVLKLLRE